MKKIITVSVIALVFVMLILHFYVYPTPETFPLKDRKTPILIAHAGGAYQGKIYTNSAEAVSNSLENGYDFIEIDLLMLSDSIIGGVHKLEEFNSITGFEESAVLMSSVEFQRRRIYDSLHPLLANDILKIFENSGAYLVTDKLENPKLLEEQIPLNKDKILNEVFSYKSYLQYLKNGYKYPMLCIWSKTELYRYLPLLIARKIKMITFPTYLIVACQKELKFLLSIGVTVFAFTSNDKEFILEYGGSTVTGFYTDSITYRNLY
ncbi:MAG: hypothetical protein LUG18_10410 [Candidatus Azobacteroides sp.]|nr:hypothetical protein [Candidatus Azobacteroides sp.]